MATYGSNVTVKISASFAARAVNTFASFTVPSGKVFRGTYSVISTANQCQAAIRTSFGVNYIAHTSPNTGGSFSAAGHYIELPAGSYQVDNSAGGNYEAAVIGNLYENTP